MKKYFKSLTEARFCFRKNRFVMRVNIKGYEEDVFLPNPGRLEELLFSGATLLLTPLKKGKNTKYNWRVVAVQKNSEWILLDTHFTNDLIEEGIKRDLIPDLKECKVIRREFTWGKSRFDFLIHMKGEIYLCEVKSCTLFNDEMAMFPDAITERGRRHVMELAEANRKGEYKSLVIFVVHSGQRKYFLPDYHTDFLFSETLFQSSKNLNILALPVEWDKNLVPRFLPNSLTVPWDWYLSEEGNKDGGTYILIFQVKQFYEIELNGVERIQLEKGFYSYVAYEKGALTKELNRIRRKKKRYKTALDALRFYSDWIGSYVIRSGQNFTCKVVEKLAQMGGDDVPEFTSLNCSFQSHVLRFKENPSKASTFQDFLLHLRMGRLVEKYNLKY